MHTACSSFSIERRRQPVNTLRLWTRRAHLAAWLSRAVVRILLRLLTWAMQSLLVLARRVQRAAVCGPSTSPITPYGRAANAYQIGAFRLPCAVSSHAWHAISRHFALESDNRYYVTGTIFDAAIKIGDNRGFVCSQEFGIVSAYRLHPVYTSNRHGRALTSAVRHKYFAGATCQ
jgi:hypothetical protein